MKPRPYKLKNDIQNYPWGTKDDAAYLADLLGTPPEPGVPYAELWMGSHPNSPSKILLDDSEKPLDEFIKSDADSILGKKVASRFKGQLPFLFKVLSVAEPLSIQTHPNKEQAALLHSAESFNYPDNNHKPEIVIAISKIDILWGFKSVESIKNFCTEYAEIAEFIGKEKFDKIFETANNPLKEFYLALVGKALSDKDGYRQLLQTIRDRLREKTGNKSENLFLRLYDRYNADVGLITIFFLNYLELNPGEAIYTPSGVPHAYLSGNVIECMANSNNVLRAGLTSKFVDVKNLLKVLKYESLEIKLIKPKISRNRSEYRTEAEEFKVIKFDTLRKNKIKLTPGSQPSIFLLIEGSAVLKWKGGEIELEKGESVFIPASLGSTQLDSGFASGYLATVNL